MGIPDGVSSELWEAFCEMRYEMWKKKGVPFTGYAKELILRKLERFCEWGYDPNESLRVSIERGWRGVFEQGERRRPEAQPLTAKTSATVQRIDDYYRRKATKDYLRDEHGKPYLLSPTTGEKVYQ